MTAEEVKEIVKGFLDDENLNGWKYEIENPSPDCKREGEWNVLIKWKSPEGVPIDGPGVVVVSDTTGATRFFA